MRSNCMYQLSDAGDFPVARVCHGDARVVLLSASYPHVSSARRKRDAVEVLCHMVS